MLIDFHFSDCQRNAILAGISGEDLRKLAYSSQFTDDNTVEYKVKKTDGTWYESRITQIKGEPFISSHTRREVYVPFHFLPGEAPYEPRVDGKTDPLCVTPCSKLCEEVMTAAIATGNMYQIGIAAHACCDSWAHQNFIGEWAEFNGFGHSIVNIGHHEAGSDPDLMGLVWTDPRLVNRRIVNRLRFDEAEAWLFRKLLSMGRQSSDLTVYDYDPYEWFNKAVKLVNDEWTFVDGYEQSDWFQFQEAAKEHAAFVDARLKERGL